MHRSLLALFALALFAAAVHGQESTFDGQNGLKVSRLSSGTVYETPYVNGKEHGTEIVRWRDGTVIETPYANGKEHGTEIWRYPDGSTREIPYVNGEKHGTEVSRDSSSGLVIETPYVSGKEHGTEVARFPDGTVIETHYANGEEVDEPPPVSREPLRLFVNSPVGPSDAQRAAQEKAEADAAQARREAEAERERQAAEAQERERRRIEENNRRILNSDCRCIGIDDRTGEYRCMDGFVSGPDSNKPLCDIRRDR